MGRGPCRGGCNSGRPARPLRGRWACHPVEVGALASSRFCKDKTCRQAPACLVSFHKRSIDASRPRGRRRPFAHLPSPSTDRARKRASFIFVPTRPPVCCSSGGAAQRRGAFSQRRLWGGLWRRRWLSSRSPSPAPSSHAHASAVRAGAELSGGEGALPAAAGRGTCASPCPPSPARQQQWCSGRGMLNAPTPKHQCRWPR